MHNYTRNVGDIARDLHALADRFAALDVQDIPLASVELSVQILRHDGTEPEEVRVAAVDQLCRHLLGVPGALDGPALFSSPIDGVDVGVVTARFYTGLVPVPSEERLAELEAETADEHGPVCDCDEPCDDCKGLTEASDG